MTAAILYVRTLEPGAPYVRTTGRPRWQILEVHLFCVIDEPRQDIAKRRQIRDSRADHSEFRRHPTQHMCGAALQAGSEFLLSLLRLFVKLIPGHHDIYPGLCLAVEFSYPLPLPGRHCVPGVEQDQSKSGC